MTMQVASDWLPIVSKAWQALDVDYIHSLNTEKGILPPMDCLLRAFSEPLSQIHFILLGESPYPRPESANGLAFWDAAVSSLWSETGLSKSVNRATSLRNWLKALLKTHGLLSDDLSQQAITNIEKSNLVQTGEQLFNNMIKRGMLLLNASLIYQDKRIPYHAKQWRPFIDAVLEGIATVRPDIELILFGKIATQFKNGPLKVALKAEHPYNLSFINNESVLEFFRPLELIYEH